MIWPNILFQVFIVHSRWKVTHDGVGRFQNKPFDTFFWHCSTFIHLQKISHFTTAAVRLSQFRRRRSLLVVGRQINKLLYEIDDKGTLLLYDIKEPTLSRSESVRNPAPYTFYQVTQQRDSLKKIAAIEQNTWIMWCIFERKFLVENTVVRGPLGEYIPQH